MNSDKLNELELAAREYGVESLTLDEILALITAARRPALPDREV